MLWEQLVTEGHIRAARLRRVAVRFLLGAIVLMGLGLAALLYRPPFALPLNAQMVLERRVSQMQQDATQSFLGLTAPPLSAKEISGLPATNQLPVALKMLRDSFQSAGEPPPRSKLTIQAAQGPADFWSGNWPHAALAYLDKGDVRAFGTLAAPPAGSFNTDNPVRPVRWLAIFRKTAAGWEDVGVQANGFVVPEGENTVYPQNLLISLRELGLPGVSK